MKIRRPLVQMSPAKAELAGLASRKLAYQLLRQMMSTSVIKMRLDVRLAALRVEYPEADHRFIRMLVLGCCRHWYGLGWQIVHYAGKPVNCLDEPVALLLRLGLYQLRPGSQIPSYAAVETTVSLAKALRLPRHLLGFVNGVLRQAVRQPVTPPPEAYLPDWLAPLIQDAEAFVSLLLEVPPVGIRLRPGCPDQWAMDLTRSGWVAEPVESIQRADVWTLTPDQPNPSSLIEQPGFQLGHWLIQEASSASVVSYMEAVCHRLIDACAGLGMKTMHLADRFPEAAIVALEPDAGRFQRLTENLARLSLSHVQALSIPAEHYQPAKWADAVLVDAPCSGTGTVRRHPDNLVQWHPDRMLPGLLAQQAQLLDVACKWVRPGGQLVYSVCSLLPEEGPRQADAFLARQPGWRLIIQHKYTVSRQQDGFYIAIFSN